MLNSLFILVAHSEKERIRNVQDKEVETMRIWTSKSYVEKDFTAEQSKQLMKNGWMFIK